MPEFVVTEERVDDLRHLVAVRGEIDLFSAPELKQVLADAIERGRTRIVIDLSETTFIDSPSLGVLVGAVKLLRPRGGSLAIVNVDENLAKHSRSPGWISSSRSAPRAPRHSAPSTTRGPPDAHGRTERPDMTTTRISVRSSAASRAPMR